MRKTSKLLWVLSLSGVLFLASCSCAPSGSNPGDKSQPATESKESQESDTPSESLTPGASAEATSGASVDPEEIDNCLVTFNTMGGSEIAPVEVKFRGRVTRPEDPVKAGYTFGAWYWDEICVTPYSFTFRITSDITLYAGWNAGQAPTPSSSEQTPIESSSEEEIPPVVESSESEPEATKADYYLVGSGPSFVGTDWAVNHGIRMDVDKTGSNKAVLANYGLKAGDTFKAVYSSDGVERLDWAGGDPAAASGQTGWKTDTSSNSNVVITADGNYDIYLNSSNQLWLEKK